MHEKLFLDAIVNPNTVPHFVSYSFLASIILIIISLIVRSTIKLVPTGTQNFMEIAMDAILDLCEENIGHDWGRYFLPFIATIGLFITVGNFLGLVPASISPTQNVNTNAAMAIPVFIATHIYGIRVHGFGYIKHFVGPIRSFKALPLMIFMFIIEVVGHIARPMTLSIRLLGNMTGKHYLLLVLGILTPALIPSLILVLGVLVALIQALVFTLLSALYLAGAVEAAH